MTNTVEIVLTATDKASKTITGFAKSFEGVGNQMTAIGIKSAKLALAGVAALGTGLAIMGAKAISAGADAEEMLSKLNVTFGDWTEDVLHGMEAFANATGRSKFELQGMATDLGAVMKGMGLGVEQTSELSMAFTQLAVDVGSFNNLPSVEVANKFRSALSGEYESLKSLGIVINQAMVEQELFNMGIEGGAKAASQADLVMARYNLIMAATGDAQGDAARTAGSFTNQMVALKAKMTDLKTEIGLRLLPVSTQLLNKFNDMASEALPKLTAAFDSKVMPVIENFSDALLALLEGDYEGALKLVFGAEISGSIMNVTKWFRDLINNTIMPFVTEHGPALVLAFKLIAGAIGALLLIKGIGALIAAITSPIGLLTIAVGLLAIAWEEDWLGIRTAVTEWWEGDGEQFFIDLEAWLAEKIPEAIAATEDAWLNTLQPALEEVSSWVETNMFPIWESVGNFFKTEWITVINLATGVWENVLLPALQSAWTWISTVMWPGLGEFIASIGGWEGILQSIVGWIDSLSAAIAGIDWPSWLTPKNPIQLPGTDNFHDVPPGRDLPTDDPPIDEDFDIGIFGGTSARRSSPFGMLAPATASGVTINATVNNGIDIERLAFRVAEVISSRQR